jgi:glycosyltransferase involved in cell wall biosynthesis
MTSKLSASVIITSYNYARYLGQAIDSALGQTEPDVEVIVVDDGSRDDSRAVIESYGSRVIALFKENGGQASSFNAGFELSRGNIILFLDSDDALLPTAVQTALNLTRQPGVAKVHWQMWAINEENTQLNRLLPQWPLDEGDFREDLILHGPGTHQWPPTSGNAWPRYTLEHLLPIPEHQYLTCPDYYLCELAPLFGLIKKADGPQTLYRLHCSNNMQTISHIEKKRLLEQVRRSLTSLLTQRGIPAITAKWKRDVDDWFERVQLVEKEIESVIPNSDRFIFVDEEHMAGDFPARRRAFPFLEREGRFNGHPVDDPTAIHELQRLRNAGAKFIVFTWFCFWWLDHYKDFSNYLRLHFPCNFESERLLIFDLR